MLGMPSRAASRAVTSRWGLGLYVPSRAAAAGAATLVPLVATRTSNVGKLAGAVAKQLRDSKASSLSAVGPTASYNALKAVVIADTYIQDDLDGASPSKRIAVVPEKIDTVHGAAFEESKGMLLRVLRVGEPIVLPDEPELFAASNTNVGLLAGLMAGRLNRDGVKSVTVGSMGDKAASNVLKATIITKTYMAESLEENELLVLVPRFNKFMENDEERMRLLLTCLTTRGSTEAE